MKNLLLELEENNVEHFIMRSYVTADFEEEENRTEYHVYHKIVGDVGKWSVKDPEYPYLKFKKLQRKEIKYFRQNIAKYRMEMECCHGVIFHHRKIGFVKPVTKPKQLELFM